MKRKPEWYAESVIAQGHVPCIQHDDSRTIYDSLIICEYLVRQISAFFFNKNNFNFLKIKLYLVCMKCRTVCIQLRLS